MFRKIIVCLDGSKEAEAALPYAADLARRYQGELMLVRVCSPGMAAGSMAGYPVESGTLETELNLSRRHVTQYLLHCQADVQEGLERVSIHVIQGSPSSAISTLAAESGADLIVLTSHGRSGFSRFLLGSVAEKLMRQAPCPVFILARNFLEGAS